MTKDSAKMDLDYKAILPLFPDGRDNPALRGKVARYCLQDVVATHELAAQNAMQVASTSQLKVAAARAVFAADVEPCAAKSGVGEQPHGRDEIRRGALNRLACCTGSLDAVAFESGLLGDSPSTLRDVTFGALRTRFGTIEIFSNELPDGEVVVPPWLAAQWLAFDAPTRSRTTAGSLCAAAGQGSADDWYEAVGHGCDRRTVVERVCQRLAACAQARSLPTLEVERPIDFQGVPFFDFHGAMAAHTGPQLTAGLRQLCRGLLFDTVLLLDSRGFLLAGPFLQSGVPVALARKPGKLPGPVHSAEYSKEYGTDTLCLQVGRIPAGARVLVLDDVVATGGSLLAAERLVCQSGATVAAFVCPFVVTTEGNRSLGLPSSVLAKLRYLSTTQEATGAVERRPVGRVVGPRTHIDTARPLVILPPSLAELGVTLEADALPVRWGHFAQSSDVRFAGREVAGRDLYLFLDPANAAEAWDVLALLSIVHRKDPASVTVVIPFMEQATQDRVEYSDDGFETLAQVDTLAKVLGQVTVVTFDLHALQSRFAFHDLRNLPLVEPLLEKYRAERGSTPFVVVFPDDGAAKRFGGLVAPGCATVVFRKKRGPSGLRVVATEDPCPGPPMRYVIVDDMVRSGGTMLAVAEYLRAAGPGVEVDALFAHAPLEPVGARRLASEAFSEVWTSDSVPGRVPPGWVRHRVCPFREISDKRKY